MSVPVLSVQITVVDPSVSTPGSRRTSASSLCEPPRAERQVQRVDHRELLGDRGDGQADAGDDGLAPTAAPDAVPRPSTAAQNTAAPIARTAPAGRAPRCSGVAGERSRRPVTPIWPYRVRRPSRSPAPEPDPRAPWCPPTPGSSAPVPGSTWSPVAIRRSATTRPRGAGSARRRRVGGDHVALVDPHQVADHQLFGGYRPGPTPSRTTLAIGAVRFRSCSSVRSAHASSTHPTEAIGDQGHEHHDRVGGLADQGVGRRGDEQQRHHRVGERPEQPSQ